MASAEPHTSAGSNLANLTRDAALSLNHIRSVLQRLEDTILFQLIERAQFAANPRIYRPSAIPELVEKEQWKESWVEWFLKESESTHAKLRRWQAPDEWPFTRQDLLPAPILPPVEYPDVLYTPSITTANDRIFEHYRDVIVPLITRMHGKDADDGQYGSAAVVDVDTLSALSRRIHFGMFVSESKFLSAPKDFIRPIRAKDTAKLEALITKPEVEARLLRRLASKAEVYGQDLDGTDRRKIEVDDVVGIYRDFVIPLTKVVEVEYLLKRLDGLTEEQISAL